MGKHEDDSPDTVEFNVIEEDGPQALPVNREEPDYSITVNSVDDALAQIKQGKVPEPALVRGLIVSVVAFIAALTGKAVGLEWVDPFLEIYAVGAPVALAWWIRRHVTPVKKT